MQQNDFSIPSSYWQQLNYHLPASQLEHTCIILSSNHFIVFVPVNDDPEYKYENEINNITLFHTSNNQPVFTMVIKDSIKIPFAIDENTIGYVSAANSTFNLINLKTQTSEILNNITYPHIESPNERIFLNLDYVVMNNGMIVSIQKPGNQAEYIYTLITFKRNGEIIQKIELQINNVIYYQKIGEDILGIYFQDELKLNLYLWKILNTKVNQFSIELQLNNNFFELVQKSETQYMFISNNTDNKIGVLLVDIDAYSQACKFQNFYITEIEGGLWSKVTKLNLNNYMIASDQYSNSTNTMLECVDIYKLKQEENQLIFKKEKDQGFKIYENESIWKFELSKIKQNELVLIHGVINGMIQLICKINISSKMVLGHYLQELGLEELLGFHEITQILILSEQYL